MQFEGLKIMPFMRSEDETEVINGHGLTQESLFGEVIVNNKHLNMSRLASQLILLSTLQL